MTDRLTIQIDLPTIAELVEELGVELTDSQYRQLAEEVKETFLSELWEEIRWKLEL